MTKLNGLFVKIKIFIYKYCFHIIEKKEISLKCTLVSYFYNYYYSVSEAVQLCAISIVSFIHSLSVFISFFLLNKSYNQQNLSNLSNDEIEKKLVF